MQSTHTHANSEPKPQTRTPVVQYIENHLPDSRVNPAERGRRPGFSPQLHSWHVLEVVGRFAAVAMLACRHTIFPGGAASSAPGDHMIDILGRLAAILALALVAHQDGPAVEGGGALRHLDIPPQRHYRWHVDRLAARGNPLHIEGSQFHN